MYGTAAPNQALPAACREFDIEPAASTLNDLTGGRDGTASMLISALLAKKRGVQYTPPAPTPSPAAQWVAKNGAIKISDDDDSDDNLVDPSASSSKKEAMERLRRARGDSSKAKRTTKSRLKARAESSSDDEDKNIFYGAAAKGAKRKRGELSAVYLLQQLPHIRF